VLDNMHGRRSIDTVSRFLPEPDRVAGAAAIDELEIADAGRTQPIPGARELLRGLPGDWAVITSVIKPLPQRASLPPGSNCPRLLLSPRRTSAPVSPRLMATCSRHSDWAFPSRNAWSWRTA